MSINQVCFSGNLTHDAELRATASGTPVLGFAMAVNNRKKVAGEWETVPMYLDVTVWGNYGEALAPHLKKGVRVTVAGRLEQHFWEKDGQKRSKHEVVANEVICNKLDSKAVEPYPVDIEDIPF
jgi:single-strand DNA-binding protein